MVVGKRDALRCIGFTDVMYKPKLARRRAGRAQTARVTRTELERVPSRLWRAFIFLLLISGPYITSEILSKLPMSGQTSPGLVRLNAYHGTKRQLIGPSAGQVPPAWRTSKGPGAATAAVNGNAAPLSKKALQRGSKILLSNLPMDVAETEIEVRVLDCFAPYIVPSFLVGAVQENDRPYEGHVSHLQ